MKPLVVAKAVQTSSTQPLFDGIRCGGYAGGNAGICPILSCRALAGGGGGATR